MSQSPIERSLRPQSAYITIAPECCSVIGKISSGIIAPATEFIFAGSIDKTRRYASSDIVRYFVFRSERWIYKIKGASFQRCFELEFSAVFKSNSETTFFANNSFLLSYVNCAVANPAFADSTLATAVSNAAL